MYNALCTRDMFVTNSNNPNNWNSNTWVSPSCDYPKVLLHINSGAPWESPSCRRCAETSVRRRPRRSDHFTCIQGVPKKMSVSGTVSFTRFWNITSETGETHHFMFLCFQPLPNLNSEVWQGARTLRSRCSPEESRKASSSPCLLCPSKKYTSFICIFYLSFYRALRVCYFLKQALS